MVQVGDRWRVQSASVSGSEGSTDNAHKTSAIRPEMRSTVTEFLEAMGFPVAS
jgi:hypothetical protein